MGEGEGGGEIIYFLCNYSELLLAFPKHTNDFPKDLNFS